MKRSTLGKPLFIAIATLVASAALAQTNLLSTQLRPIEEAEKMRRDILKGIADTVNFMPEDPNYFAVKPIIVMRRPLEPTSR